MSSGRFSLAGKIALITGGTRGIGRAIALEFARAGARVVVASRKQAGVDAVVAELKALGPDASGVSANVSKPWEPRRIIEHAVSAFGGIDILVNNAAVNPVFGPVEETSVEAFDKIMAVNVRAPFELSTLALPRFRERGGGAILNISSIGGLTPEENLGIYSVSKAAIISLTKVQSRSWGKDNIRANVICPGLIKTEFSSALWQDEKIMRHMMRNQAIARLGEPEDIAGLALFLCSEAGSFCTGGVYVADGGYTV
ncbi:MAG: SDR family NAD(P)-dependent oxidoreductase [Gemmatimonadales bacterium]